MSTTVLEELPVTGFAGDVESRELVSGDLAREHIRLLQERGLCLLEISRQAGVAPKTLERLMHGSRTEVGTQTKILTVTSWERLTSRTVGRRHVDGTGTRRRLQALAARGWTAARLAEHHTATRQKIRQALISPATEPVTAQFARSVISLYDDLWDRDPPCPDGAAQARAEAITLGWAPPMAWDDETIDDPDVQPPPPRPAEGRSRPCLHLEDLEDCVAWGLDVRGAAERLRVSTAAVEVRLRRAEREDLLRRLRANGMLGAAA